MEERSSARASRAFTRGRLVVGILLVAVIGAAAAYGLGRLRGEPDPGRLIYADRENVFVRELDSGEVRTLAALPKKPSYVQPSPDGRWLAYIGREFDLGMIDLESGRRWTEAEGGVVPFGWSPDARLFVKDVGSGKLVAVDPDGAKRVIADRFRGFPPVWIDPERFLTWLDGDLMLVRTSGDDTSVSKLADSAIPLAASPDGKEIVYGSASGTARVTIARLTGDRLASKRIVFRSAADRAMVSPTGYIAIVSDTDREGIWILRGGSMPARRVLDGRAGQVAWSRDGSALVYRQGGSLFARDIRDGRTVRLTPRGSHVFGFAVVP